MIVNISEKEELINKINDMRHGEAEQMILTVFYSLKNYFRSLYSFGLNSKVTKDNLKVIQEMFFIIKVERKLLNYIVKNIDTFAIGSTFNIVEMLDELNDKTILYYYKVMDDITFACDIKDEGKGSRIPCDFTSLSFSHNYVQEIVALSENLESLQSFLGFEEEFWCFIKKKIAFTDKSFQSDIPSVTPFYDKEGLVSDLKLVMPKISNLETALLSIRLYKEAYEIYKLLGKKLDYKLLEDSKQLEEFYKKEYLYKKASYLFN